MHKPERIIYDPIHGHYSLPRNLWDFIDNPVYQRLRDLKQLGTTCFVFPGGTHSRFEHCLGVGHLSRKYIKSFQKRQPELEISARDVDNLTLAGMMHDLGHGPFSHIFDSDVVPALGINDWSHEKASVALLDFMVDQFNIDIEREDLRMVGDMVEGTGQGFRYQIVNNALNSIDVDKFDYIERDCHCLGFRAFPFDSQRMMKRSLVIGDTICFNEKVVHSIYSLFSSRFNLFQQCYSHRVGQAIGLMIRDALVEANEHINLVERIRKMRMYYKLTDNVLHEIENSSNPKLGKAKKIIENIHFRKLYTMAGQIIVGRDTDVSHINENIIAGYNSHGNGIRPEDIIVKKFTLTYGNPAANVFFFNEGNTETPYSIPSADVSSLIPANYCDRFVRVFVKDADKLEAAKEAFQRFKKKETSA
jgi:deoxynucleoside triphosphate triphosphohydrolase SAMHD1